ncbi:MAG: 3-oxoacyl-[acyl-carrier-protein] reductase [Deltaproteobacteria bacterium]|nr:3-oxoacyl-[acyl-carrier-protein] reductase [Deltaproteobacteria bacterium]MBI3390767.1 3-oxoacyl-[acyl-carrier-protein] reductase [Deltaproteobacteria bacterium]
MSPLADQVALVTGGSRGIGRAIAQRLAAQGARVVITYVSNQAAADECVRAIKEAAGDAEAVQFDVADGEATGTAVTELVERCGRLDVLINNAGITIDTLILRMKADDWDRVLAVNLRGAFNCTKAAARTMVRARYGRIVNITSVIAEMGNAGQGAYAAAKAGLIGFTKSMARELAARNITVNAVSPGFIETEMVQRLPETVRAEYLKAIPAGRLGTAEEVAAAVAFLVQPEAGYITGQVVGVNGGLYM